VHPGAGKLHRREQAVGVIDGPAGEDGDGAAQGSLQALQRGTQPGRRRHVRWRRGDIEQGAVEIEKKSDACRIVDLQTHRLEFVLRPQIVFAFCTYHRVLARIGGGFDAHLNADAPQVHPSA
jgi:hypothetical protein